MNGESAPFAAIVRIFASAGTLGRGGVGPHGVAQAGGCGRQGNVGVAAAAPDQHGPSRGSVEPVQTATHILGIDATLVAAHSDKEKPEPDYKRGCGFHPMPCYVDGTEEQLAGCCAAAAPRQRLR